MSDVFYFGYRRLRASSYLCWYVSRIDRITHSGCI